VLKDKSIPLGNTALAGFIDNQDAKDLVDLPTMPNELGVKVALFCRPKANAPDLAKKDEENYDGSLIDNLAILIRDYPDPDLLLQAVDSAVQGIL
jgi:hypothetical protein